MGRIELEEKNFAKAIDFLNKAKALLPSEYGGWDMRLQIFSALGRTYAETDQMDKARDEYEAIGLLTFGRMYKNIIYVKAFYELGKVYQSMGDKAKALENYHKFLDIWKNADPGIAEVEDARKRLADLKNL